jgi:hypothetical protein
MAVSVLTASLFCGRSTSIDTRKKGEPVYLTGRARGIGGLLKRQRVKPCLLESIPLPGQLAVSPLHIFISRSASLIFAEQNLTEFR